MDGRTAAGVIRQAGPKLDWARPEDAEAIASLLSEPLPGSVHLSLADDPAEYEPRENAELRHQAIVVRNHGRILAHGARTVRRIWLNGRKCWAGYLHGLRRSQDLAGDGRRLAMGLARLRDSQRADESDYDFTAIFSDNSRARRVLESGIPGAPHYHFLSEYRTSIVSTKFARRLPANEIQVRPCPPEAMDDVQELVDRHSPEYSPAVAINPAWLTAWHADRIVGAACVIDRNRQRKIMVSGYAWKLALARPIMNGALRLRKMPLLPKPPASIDVRYVAHVTVPDGNREVLLALIRKAASLCPMTAKIVLGFGRNHELSASVESLPAWRFSSRIYAVGGMPAAQSKTISPEAAWL